MNNSSQQNPFDPKVILVIAGFLIFYMFYSQHMQKKYGNVPATETTDTTNTAPADGTNPAGTAPATAGAVTAPAPTAEIVALSAADRTFETSDAIFVISQTNGGFENVTLKAYRTSQDKDAAPVALSDTPIAIAATLASEPDAAPAATPQFAATRTSPNSITLTRTVGQWRIDQTYDFTTSTGYSFKSAIKYTNTGADADLVTRLVLAENLTVAKTATFSLVPGQVSEITSTIVDADGSVERLAASDLCDDNDTLDIPDVTANYFGFDKHYFLQSLSPVGKGWTVRAGGAPTADGRCFAKVSATQKQGLVGSNQSVTIEFTGYFGPKALDTIEKANTNLTSSINMGFFSFVAYPLLAAIRAIGSAVGNYGWAIIALTLALKILFYPLTRATAVSMHKMKKLNPQMQAIREKFADDKQKQQQELMRFMAANKVNPLKGCLPILPQIPVFFALYQVLQSAIELRHAPFAGWIHDLSASDPYFITPVLWGLGMFVQQRLTPTTGMDKTQERMMQILPIVFTIPMLTLPAGMILYLLTNTATSIAQQQWLNRRLDKIAS